MEASSQSRGLAHRVEELSPAGAMWVGAASTAMIVMAMITLMGWFGPAAPTDLYWRTGTAVVSDDARSAVVEDADAQALGQVPLWFDGFGFVHDHGWPSCLAPAGARVTIRFALTPSPTQQPGTVAGGARPIAAVDCRQP